MTTLTRRAVGCRRTRGLSGTECMLVVAMSVLAMVGLSRYLRYAAAGHLKNSADQLGGGLLVNPDASQIALQHCQDSFSKTETVGLVLETGKMTVTKSGETLDDRVTLSGAPPAIPDCVWTP